MLKEIVSLDETQIQANSKKKKERLFFVIPEINLLNEAQRLKKKISKDYHIK